MAIGAELRNARIQRGLTIEQVAQDTRISARFLRALEEDDFEALPAPVYVRGFLRSYANYLRIDSQPLLDELNAELESPSYTPDDSIGGPGPGRQSSAQSLPRAAVPPSDPFRRSPANRAPPPPVIDDLAPPPVRAPEIWEEAPLAASASQAAPPPPGVPANRPRPRGVSGDPFVRGAFPPPAPPEEEAAASWDDDYADPIYVDEPIYDDEPDARQRGRAGAAVYRPDSEPDDSQRTRLVVLFAVIGLAGIIFVALAILLVNRDNGGSNNTAAPLPTTTPVGRTVIAVGSTTPTAVASASSVASPDANASTSPTPAGTPAATNTAGPTNTPGPTSTPRPNVPTATPDLSTATPTPDPNTPTATLAPPTATPPPPTPTLAPPTPTPFPQHAHGFEECVPNGYCSQDGTGNIRVICAPDGWFVDGPANGRFNNIYGWPEKTVTRNADAARAC